jgi:hypothetical protein
VDFVIGCPERDRFGRQEGGCDEHSMAAQKVKKKSTELRQSVPSSSETARRTIRSVQNLLDLRGGTISVSFELNRLGFNKDVIKGSILL